MRQGAWCRSAAGALIALALAVPVKADVAEVIAATYDEFSMTPPTLDSVVICHGFGCNFRIEVELTEQDSAMLADIMAAGRTSAAAERQSLAKAGAWFDRRIAPAAGTVNHIARARIPQMFDAGQYDCIDTSRNMTSLLLVLDQMKLLRYHTVGLPASRGHLIDGRSLHVTAVMLEKTGTRWAIDPWTRGYGQAPEIMPLSLWMTKD